jgi:hypothetical protein
MPTGQCRQTRQIAALDGRISYPKHPELEATKASIRLGSVLTTVRWRQWKNDRVVWFRTGSRSEYDRLV